jgi:hypothetical protein
VTGLLKMKDWIPLFSQSYLLAPVASHPFERDLRAGTPRSLIKQRRAVVTPRHISFCYPKDTPPDASQSFLSSNGNTSGGVAERLSLFDLSIQPHVSRRL